MAGIGFELRKLVEKGRLSTLGYALGYSFMLAPGPAIISISSIVGAGFVYSDMFGSVVRVFQVVVTHVVAYSLIISSCFQFFFTRYVADRLFEEKPEKVFPNLNGALSVAALLSFLFGLVYYALFLRDLPPMFCLEFVVLLVLMSMNWVLNSLLTGLKGYRYILLSYLFSYGIFLLAAYPLGKVLKLEGIILAFLLGQAILFFSLYVKVFIDYHSEDFVDYEFLSPSKSYYILVPIGFLYNLSIWADKFTFWYHPLTGTSVLGPFYASIVYDIPIFLAYISIASGLAIMTLYLEAYFSQSYERYYYLVVKGGTLKQLFEKAIDMAQEAKLVIVYTAFVQIITDSIILIFAEKIFGLLKLSVLYIPLFRIQLLGVTFQLLLTALIALLFYYDRRKEVLVLTSFYTLSNVSTSVISIQVGPYFYGYGLVISSVFVFTLAYMYLRRFFGRLHYETFMLVR